jgi:hypothetical protein
VPAAMPPKPEPTVEPASEMRKGVRKLIVRTMFAVPIAATAIIGAGSAESTAALKSTGAPRQFFGTIAFNDPTAAEFALMGRGRVGTYRTNLSWQAVEPFGPSSAAPEAWARYDSLIGDAAANGIRVLPTIYGSPGWVASTPQTPPDAAHLADFAAFAQAAAKRYGRGGQFWTDPSLYQADHPGAAARPVRVWQIWNEPNSPEFWAPRPSARAYAEMLAAARGAIHGVDPSATVLTAGLVGNPNIQYGIPMVKYLTQLYRFGGRGIFDAVSVHPYARTPRRALRTVESARAVMDEHGDARKPIWVTEIGWATSGTRTPLTVGRKLQASYLRQTFSTLATHRKRDDIGGVIWFSLKDQSSPVWFYRTGLFTRAGKPKPSWKAFVKFTGGSASRAPPPASASRTSGGIFDTLLGPLLVLLAAGLAAIVVRLILTRRRRGRGSRRPPGTGETTGSTSGTGARREPR